MEAALPAFEIIPRTSIYSPVPFSARLLLCIPLILKNLDLTDWKGNLL